MDDWPFIAEAVKQAYARHGGSGEEFISKKQQKSEQEIKLQTEIREVISKRRALNSSMELNSAERKRMRRDLCKQAQKLTRKKVKARQEVHIDRILEEFRGLKDIASIKGEGKKCLITCIEDCNGVQHSDQATISEVFQKFKS